MIHTMTKDVTRQRPQQNELYAAPRAIKAAKDWRIATTTARIEELTES